MINSQTLSEVRRAELSRLQDVLEVRDATPALLVAFRFAYERHRVMMARLDAQAPPWTADPVLGTARFVNVWRVCDRASQHLITHVVPESVNWSLEDALLRLLVFKVFNRVDTWEYLERGVGEVSWATFDPEGYSEVVEEARQRGSVFSSAYIMPSPRKAYGGRCKSLNLMRMVAHIMRHGLCDVVREADDIGPVIEQLERAPGVGSFLATQYALDISYLPHVGAHAHASLPPGPGVLDGLSKAFVPGAAPDPSVFVSRVVERQAACFGAAGLEPPTLFGLPLQPIDVHNILCELSKYTRVTMPHLTGRSGRTALKRGFRPSGPLAPIMLPSSWGLHGPLTASESVWFGRSQPIDIMGGF